jgi:molybdopterin converting factor small subunit
MGRAGSRFRGVSQKPVSIKIDTHYFIPSLTSDRDIVEVNGSTVGECFDQLAAVFPKTREWLIARDGAINNAIEVYVNQESVLPEGLAKPVKDGDIIHIVMLISGG